MMRVMHSSTAGELALNGISLPKSQDTSAIVEFGGVVTVKRMLMFKKMQMKMLPGGRDIRSSLTWAKKGVRRNGTMYTWCLQD